MNGRWPLAILLASVSALLSSEASAQVGRRIPSVVQLPSFQVFSYNGTVVVPDSGTGYLGGNKSYSSGSRQRGWNRAFGASLRNPQVSITPTIIDNNEIDRKLLGGTPGEFLKSSRGKVVAAQKKMDPTEEGKSLVRFARQQYRKGDETGSFESYQLAIGVLQGRLRDLATVEFRRVFGEAADQSLRMAAVRR